MAVEDGAALGALFENTTTKSQIPDVLSVYETVRKARTTRIVQSSTILRGVYHMPDGPGQQERDRQLLEEPPFEGFPNCWADPAFQRFMFGYDSYNEAYRAWDAYIGGKYSHDGMKFSARL